MTGPRTKKESTRTPDAGHAAAAHICRTAHGHRTLPSGTNRLYTGELPDSGLTFVHVDFGDDT